MKKSDPGPFSEADRRLNRAYRLCDRFLAEIRALQTIQALTSKAESRGQGVYERQPEPIGAILKRIFKQGGFCHGRNTNLNLAKKER